MFENCSYEFGKLLFVKAQLSIKRKHQQQKIFIFFITESNSLSSENETIQQKQSDSISEMHIVHCTV